MSVENEQEKLNSEMKNSEKIEFYEDKLLQMKMISFLDNYKREHELGSYKKKLDELKHQKDSILEEKNHLSDSIKEIKETNNNYEKVIDDYNTKIKSAEKEKIEIENEIQSKKQYLESMDKEENFVDHIIKNFSDDFKKEIYDICSKAVGEALNGKKDANNNHDEKINNNTNKIKNNAAFTQIPQRAGFFPYNMTMQGVHPIQGMQGMQGMGPMMIPPYNFMVYPVYGSMPTQNMGSTFTNQIPFMVPYGPSPIVDNKNNTNDKNKAK